MAAVVEDLAGRVGMLIADVDLVIAHQANARILTGVAAQIGIPEERAYSNIARLGNTSGASIPLALCDAAAEGRLQDGHRLIVTAFGAGFLWGACCLQWGTAASVEAEHATGGAHV
jgi:3-oxoacyl-[acyl-carrier-protein] synthase-3